MKNYFETEKKFENIEATNFFFVKKKKNLKVKKDLKQTKVLN